MKNISSSKSARYHKKLYDASKQEIKRRIWIARENSNLIGPIYKHNEAIWHFFNFGEQKVRGLIMLQRGKDL